MNAQHGIAFGGKQRLRRAVEAKIRREHEVDLATAKDECEKARVLEQIQQETEQCMKELVSPYTLWSSP